MAMRSTISRDASGPWSVRHQADRNRRFYQIQRERWKLMIPALFVFLPMFARKDDRNGGTCSKRVASSQRHRASDLSIDRACDRKPPEIQPDLFQFTI